MDERMINMDCGKFTERIKRITLFVLIFIMFVFSGCSNDNESKTDHSDETTITQRVDFSEDWYRTYTYFASDSGDILEIGFYDNETWFSAYINGLDMFDTDGASYSQDTDGAYVYKADVGGGELRYYPNDGNYLIFIFDGESTTYYPVDEEQVVINSSETYMPGVVSGNDLKVDVFYAYTIQEYGDLLVEVECVITNMTNSEMIFNAANYFELTNNGIIKTGFCDYDYNRLAAGASFQTTIKFLYPGNANANLANMVLRVDGSEVYLVNDPNKMQEMEGIYYKEGAGYPFVIVHRYDNQYYWIHYSDISNGVKIYEIVLDSNNIFTISEYSTYQWIPEYHMILGELYQAGGNYTYEYYKY